MENVSTKTIIATSSLEFDIISIFNKMPLGGNDDISLELLYYQNQKRGDTTLMKNKTRKCFRNAVNVVTRLKGNKCINFKLSKNGKFQLTGCKNEQHAISSVVFFIQKVLSHCPDCLVAQPKEKKITIYFQTVMTNIDFSLGFCVDRQKLDYLLNKNTPFHSLLETSFGYTGVNIKFPLSIPWWRLHVPVVVIDTDNTETYDIKYEPLESVCTVTPEMMTKKKYNTFLVFHSGNVIMSGMQKETMNEHYELFLSMTEQWKNEIEEKIKN